MSQYFDRFPQIPYDINQDGSTHKEIVTDIFFRIAFLQAIKTNKVAYYYYSIEDGETPESLADKVYNNVEAHWLILLLNDIIDPQYDWPLDQQAFNRYIIAKYGSIAAAMSQPFTQEKRVDYAISGIAGQISVSTVFSSEIDAANVTTDFSSTHPDIPYDNYAEMPTTQTEIFDLGESTNQVIATTTKSQISAFDYEHNLNEAKRNIKILHADAYAFVIDEFTDLLKKYNINTRIIQKTARV